MKIRLYPLTANSGNYASQVYSGLFDLEYDGRIDLSVLVLPPVIIKEDPQYGNGRAHLVYLEIEDARGDYIKVVFDLYDAKYIISPSALKCCDIYFKRSYLKSHIESYLHEVEFENCATILPYGLFQTGRSHNEHSIIWRTVAFLINTGLWYKRPIRAMKIFANELLNRNQYHCIHSGSTEVDTEYKVLFQTRINDPISTSSPDKTTLINQFRVDLIMALRKEFGDQFVGGLLPNDFAKENYPNLITLKKTDKFEYFKLISRSLIGVVTVGLEDSTPQKMAEYLSYSKCIVSENLPYEIPTPLVTGKHVMYFQTTGECIQACKDLLMDTDAIKDMKHHNKAYYNQNVLPSELIWGALSRAVAANSDN